jgi:hypothetical protein
MLNRNKKKSTNKAVTNIRYAVIIIVTHEPQLTLSYDLLQIKPNTCMAAAQYQLKEEPAAVAVDRSAYLAIPTRTLEDGQLGRNM